jgi:hypothetical protein
VEATVLAIRMEYIIICLNCLGFPVSCGEMVNKQTLPARNGGRKGITLIKQKTLARNILICSKILGIKGYRQNDTTQYDIKFSTISELQCSGSRHPHQWVRKQEDESGMLRAQAEHLFSSTEKDLKNSQ